MLITHNISSEISANSTRKVYLKNIEYILHNGHSISTLTQKHLFVGFRSYCVLKLSISLISKDEFQTYYGLVS